MLLSLLLASVTVFAGGWEAEREIVWDTKGHRYITLRQMEVDAGDIIVFGEDHATKENAADPQTAIHHDNQMRLLEQLQVRSAEQGLSLSVGMEFLTYTYQTFVDQFLTGVLPELDFLREVHWSSNPFEYYRRQILSPQNSGGKTIALNIPAKVAGLVAQNGPGGLSEEDRKLLPPVWERGNAHYFERFSDIMKDHVPSDALENYFWAQSLWDSTMTWKALEHRKQMPNDVMVIIVGAFHVEYGGGLPFELRKQGAKVKTVMQVIPEDWEWKTIKKILDGDPKYGPLADYIWIHSGAEAVTN